MNLERIIRDVKAYEKLKIIMETGVADGLCLKSIYQAVPQMEYGIKKAILEEMDKLVVSIEEAYKQ